MIEVIIAGISASVATLSAWLAWRASRPRPRIAGQVRPVIHLDVSGNFTGTAVMVHLVVTNETPHPVHLMEFTLEVDRGDGHGLRRLLDSRQARGMTMPELFLDDQYKVEMTEDSLVGPPMPVAYGSPSMGFLVGLYEGRLEQQDIEQYRVTASDVFGAKHTITAGRAEVDQWLNHESYALRYLFRHAGVPVTDLSAD